MYVIFRLILDKLYEKDERVPSRPLDLSFMGGDCELSLAEIETSKRDAAPQGADEIIDDAVSAKLTK